MEDARISRDDAEEMVRTFSAMSEAHGREDLVERLAGVGRRLQDPAITVIVVGEFKQGKSTLVNALLDTDVCAVDDAVPTAVPTFVRHAEEASATAIFGFGDDERVVPVSLDHAASLTADTDESQERPASLVLGLPRRLLEDGLVVVDTPGIGGLDSRHGVATLGALDRAEAVVFVTDASQELTATELDFLRIARGRCPTVALVLTKVDITPAWRKILEIDRGHLQQAGLDVPMFPVASPLRLAATMRDDLELDEESGYAALVDYVRSEIVARADAVAVAAVGSELHDVVDHLELRVTAELRALQQGGDDIVRAFEEARARSERLEVSGGRWQVALDDGFADLSADLDHELRTTMRQLRKAADDAIDESDPGQTWGELEPRLNRRIMADVLSCYSLLDDRVHQLATDIATMFLLDEEEVAEPLQLRLGTPIRVAAIDVPIRSDPSRLGKEVLTALRGVQGGVVVFGMVAQLAGLALTGPATVAVGLVMGGRSLREERKRQLALRRQRAKVPVRKCLDEAQLVVAKDTKDRLRVAQRTLRDAFNERAAALHRSTQDAREAAERAVGADATTRAERLRAIDHERRVLEQRREEIGVFAR